MAHGFARLSQVTEVAGQIMVADESTAGSGSTALLGALTHEGVPGSCA